MNLTQNIQSTAKKVLLQEAEAIKNLANYIDDDFENCVNFLLKIQGRVVVSGIGKSGIIAQKLVATLNSTGTPAVFMHAADAIHGDLGMVQPHDALLVISKSGDTPELKLLVPLLKRGGQKLICIVSKTNSYLAKAADYVLKATVAAEACPLNLAPTTSTTASLALADALAVCLLEQRGFSTADFAQLHPGGSLGKKLYLKVSDIYPNNALPVVAPTATIKNVIVEISSKRLGITIVQDQAGNMLGVITDGDIRRMLDTHHQLQGLTAQDIMTTKPITIAADEYAQIALHLMQDKNITQLVATHNNKAVGVVHLHDLLKEGLI
jgi:arabinose-5-phosphate isomerase